ncbi:translational activator of GCN4 [Nowakowskiella sp. JEL0407]|nr:translational activator of GCN4 [Nowakowskiella sp. JEL0407]
MGEQRPARQPFPTYSGFCFSVSSSGMTLSLQDLPVRTSLRVLSAHRPSVVSIVHSNFASSSSVSLALFLPSLLSLLDLDSFRSVSPTLLDYYRKTFLASKVRISLDYLKAFAPFFARCEIADSISLFPIIDRGLLRSPEVILSQLSAILSAIPPTSELSEYITKFAKSCLNYLKSTNEKIRSDAVDLWCALNDKKFSLSKDLKLEMLKVLVESLSQKSTIDIKSVLLTALQTIEVDGDIAEKYFVDVKKILDKETNETLYAQTATIFSSHISVYISSSSILTEKFLTFLKEGIVGYSSVKRMGFWNVINQFQPDDITQLKSVKSFITLVDECSKIMEKTEKVQNLVDPTHLKNGGYTYLEGIILINFLYNFHGVKGTSIFIKFCISRIFNINSHVSPAQPPAFVLTSRFFSLVPQTHIPVLFSIFFHLLTLRSPSLVSPLASLLTLFTHSIDHKNLFNFNQHLTTYFKKVDQGQTPPSETTYTISIILDSIATYLKKPDEPRDSSYPKPTERSSKTPEYKIFRLLECMIPDGLFNETDTPENPTLIFTRQQLLLSTVTVLSHPKMVYFFGTQTFVKFSIKCGQDPILLFQEFGRVYFDRLIGSETNESSSANGTVSVVPKGVEWVGKLDKESAMFDASVNALMMILEFHEDLWTDVLKFVLGGLECRLKGDWKSWQLEKKRRDEEKNNAAAIAGAAKNTTKPAANATKIAKPVEKKTAKKVQSPATQQVQTEKKDFSFFEVSEKLFFNVLEVLESLLSLPVSETFLKQLPRLVKTLTSIMVLELGVVDESEARVIVDESAEEETLLSEFSQKKVIFGGLKVVRVWNLLGNLLVEEFGANSELKEEDDENVELDDEEEKGPVKEELVLQDIGMVVCRVLGVADAEFGVEKKYRKSTLTKSLKTILPTLPKLHPALFTYLSPIFSHILFRKGRVLTSIKSAKSNLEISLSVSDILLKNIGIGKVNDGSVERKYMVDWLIRVMEMYEGKAKGVKEGLMGFSVGVGESMVDDDEDGDDEYDDEDGEKIPKVNDEEFLKRRKLEELDIIGAFLNGMDNEKLIIRETCVSAMTHIFLPIIEEVENAENVDAEYLLKLKDVVARFRVLIYIEMFDAESVQEEAKKVWEEQVDDEVLEEDEVFKVVEYIVHLNEPVRKNSSLALATLLEAYPDLTSTILSGFYKTYDELTAIPPPEYDEFGLIKNTAPKPDIYAPRLGISTAIVAIATHITGENINGVFEFLLQKGLQDKNQTVAKEMLEAGIKLIQTQCPENQELINELYNLFKQHLESSLAGSGENDKLYESVVILLGTLSRFLDEQSNIIYDIVDKLVFTLKTPSETVQIAVSECLAPLCKSLPDEVVKSLVERLKKELFESPKYGERRGAAYGIAAIVKGRGISSLKEYGIMQTLKDSVESKTVEKRQGSMFTFETLSYLLGRLFEPYVIQILPVLLTCFGDSSKAVREATEDASRVIMSKLSAHCVKLVLPSLLRGLEDKSWRSKIGSIEMLGSMSYLAPKQLSQSLPTIIPKLCEVLSDSHQKVAEAAKTSLQHFGKIIKNPEIQTLVPVIIAALVEPNLKTLNCLNALLETAFIHYIDAPSLALVVPVLRRGLKERSTDIKKKSSQIMGNMASLTDSKDLIPYIPVLLPGLKEVLVDPVPEARAIAAKALGSMVERLGEDTFPGIIAELFETLKSDTSAVDRSGAAQGLSEIVAGLGLKRLEELLPEVIANTSSTKSYVREGFMTLLVYLPATHGEKFTPYLGMIIPSVLLGLADESELVRESALQSARMIIKNYSLNALDLLMPELEKGLFDENWRIRLSSVQLLGDLLRKIAGMPAAKVLAAMSATAAAIGQATTTDNVTEEDNPEETLGTDVSRHTLMDVLGKDRYENVIASLYIVRADQSAVVRQGSVVVWKTIISNTPRTLREILKPLMALVINNLGSSSYERRGVAARTLGDLVKKLGENVLERIVPIFEKGLDSPDPAMRQGCCIGMTEIMASAGKQDIEEFVMKCIPAVQKALIDPEDEIREAAAQTFDMVHQHLGSVAIDRVLPPLLNQLKTHTGDGNNYALEALKEIMAVRSNVVFPVLIPTLITKPITPFNARALGSLIAVAGSALNKRLNTILPALLESLVSAKLKKVDGDEKAVVVSAEPDIQDTLRVLLESVEEDGLSTLMPIFNEAVSDIGMITSKPSSSKAGKSTEKSPQYKRAMKIASCDAVGTFFAVTKLDVLHYTLDWVAKLIGFLVDDDEEVLMAAWKALSSATASLKKDDFEQFVAPIRKAIKNLTDSLKDGEIVQGFCLPKGISPLLPILQHGILNGNADIREQSALALGDIMKFTSVDGLKPFVTQITGALIRVLGEKFSPNVKAGILQTLLLLVTKMTTHLKTFLPQLQRTFIKSLSEPGKEGALVRDRAAKCLSVLIPLLARLDPLVVELAQGIRGTEDRGIREAIWDAVHGLLQGCVVGGKEISDTSKKTVEALLAEGIRGEDYDDGTRISASKCFGPFSKYLPHDEAKRIITTYLFKPALQENATKSELHGIILSINSILSTSPTLIETLKLTDTLASVLQTCTAGVEAKITVAETAVQCVGILLSSKEYMVDSMKSTDSLILMMIGLIGVENQAEIRREALVVLKNLAKHFYDIYAPYLAKVIPSTMIGVRDRVFPIKHAAERLLFYSFKMQVEVTGPDSTGRTLKEYLDKQDAATAKSIGDYCRRVLSKFSNKDSDAEDE